MSTNNDSYKPGLEGVIAAETHLSHVDGQKGELIIAGFPVEELATKATFEEVAYLLWHDKLPNNETLARFRHELITQRALPPATLQLLDAVAQERKPTIDALRMAASTLDLGVATPDNQQLAVALLARLPTVVATYWRLLQGLDPVLPDPHLSHAANYLYMLSGQQPSAAQVRGLDTYLNTVVDHGLNASTFAARVIIATHSDMVSALVGAIGALKGPRHGGAPGPALELVFEIGEASRAEVVLRGKLERRERLMGFGHRIYKVRDPRAEVLSQAAEQMFRNGGDMQLFNLAKTIEGKAVELLDEYKPGLKLRTNVEFYTALILHGLGLPTELFTPTFAIARAGGWIAHCFEQLATGRLIRPSSLYVGALGRVWE